MRTLTSRPVAVLLALLVVPPLLGCGSSDSGTGVGGERNAPSSITVLADESLKEPFTAIGKQFEDDNAGKTVTFTFGPAADVANQAAAGKDGDVVATPNPSPMDTTEEVQAGALKVFASKGSTTYAIVTLAQTRNASLSNDFINYVAGPPGQSILQQQGFQGP